MSLASTATLRLAISLRGERAALVEELNALRGPLWGTQVMGRSRLSCRSKRAFLLTEIVMSASLLSAAALLPLLPLPRTGVTVGCWRK